MRFVKIMAFLSAFIMLCSCSSQSADISSNRSNVSKQSTVLQSKNQTIASKQSSAINSSENLSVNSSKTSSKNSATSQKASSQKTSSAASQIPTVNVNGLEKYSGTRDPWLWPFAATSIWNMPIGSDAKLQKANFKEEYCISIDDEYLVKVPEGSPTVDVYAPSGWQTRWPGNRKLGTMQVPANFYLADARQGSTPNNCAAFLMPDGRTVRQLEPCCRLETGNARIVGYLHDEDQDIFGDGIKGTHYGSGLSAIGGSIRKGELTSNEPIKHALKLNVYAKNYLYYDRSAKQGYIWPADRHDSYAASGNNAYGGSNPNLRMGALLTIPKNITAESLGITTQVGKKLFYALQNYGCYIADDSAWSCYAFSAESGVCDEVQAKYGINLNTNRSSNDNYYKDSMKLIQNLYIVTNNSPNSIGGGGTPCKPLAPDFE